jgi:hypothetical protein
MALEEAQIFNGKNPWSVRESSDEKKQGHERTVSC